VCLESISSNKRNISVLINQKFDHFLYVLISMIANEMSEIGVSIFVLFCLINTNDSNQITNHFCVSIVDRKKQASVI
jgi:hypothetical protein